MKGSTLNSLGLITVDHIRMKTAAGAEIGECAILAAILCLEHRAKVIFPHNGKDYTADPWEIVRLVLPVEPDPGYATGALPI